MESKKQNKWTNTTKRNRLVDTENKWVIARGEGVGRVSEIGEGRLRDTTN